MRKIEISPASKTQKDAQSPTEGSIKKNYKTLDIFRQNQTDDSKSIDILTPIYCHMCFLESHTGSSLRTKNFLMSMVAANLTENLWSACPLLMLGTLLKHKNYLLYVLWYLMGPCSWDFGTIIHLQTLITSRYTQLRSVDRKQQLFKSGLEFEWRKLEPLHQSSRRWRDVDRSVEDLEKKTLWKQMEAASK